MAPPTEMGVDPSTTLLVVTSDHGHPLVMHGYQRRGRDVRDLTGGRFADGLPYTTMSYGNGPGFPQHFSVDRRAGEIAREDLSGYAVKDPGFV